MTRPDSARIKRWVRFPGLPALAFVVAILLIEWTTPARTTETLACNPDEAMVVSPDRGGLVDDEDGFRYEFWSKTDFPSDREAESVLEWCEERFGESSEMGRWIPSGNGTTVWIRNESDAFEFKLRWVG